MARKPRVKAAEEQKAPVADSKIQETPVNNEIKEQEKKAIAEKAAAETQKAIADALIMYQNDTSINTHLANNGLTDEQKKCVDRLDKAMLPLAEMELSRLVLKEVLDGYMKQVGVKSLKDLEGKVIENVPYMSMSKNPLRAMLQARYELGLDKPNCIVMQTDNTGNLKGIDVCTELREAGLPLGRAEKQKEIIIERGRKFLVKKVVFGDEWGEAYPIIHLYAV